MLLGFINVTEYYYHYGARLSFEHFTEIIESVIEHELSDLGYNINYKDVDYRCTFFNHTIDICYQFLKRAISGITLGIYSHANIKIKKNNTRGCLFFDLIIVGAY